MKWNNLLFGSNGLCLLQVELLQRCSWFQSADLRWGRHSGLDTGLHWYRTYWNIFDIITMLSRIWTLHCFHMMNYFARITTSQTSWVLQSMYLYSPHVLIAYSMVELKHSIYFLAKLYLFLLVFKASTTLVGQPEMVKLTLWLVYKHFHYVGACVFRGGKIVWLRELENNILVIICEKKITWPLFGLEDVFLVQTLKNCLNFLSIKTKRGNNRQAKCVSWNRLYNWTFILICSFTSGPAKWIWCFHCKSVSLFSWVRHVSHHVVIFVPLLQIRPTWTGTPLCVYFLLAQATIWHDVCVGAEVLTENRYMTVKYMASIHLITFTAKEMCSTPYPGVNMTMISSF